MLAWIRSFWRLGRGDAVKVTDGPYAGQVRRARRRDVGRAARDAKLNDPEAVMRRHELESRRMGNRGGF